MSDGVINDPDLYLRLREPFDGGDEFNAACEKFYEGMRELRKTCGLPDVLVVIAAPVKADDAVSEIFTMQTCGDFLRQETMAAWAFGRCQEQREAMVNRLLGSKKAGERKRGMLFD